MKKHMRISLNEIAIALKQFPYSSHFFFLMLASLSFLDHFGKPYYMLQ